MEERHVLDDERVGLHHRLAGADRAVVDPAERDDRRAHAFGAEAREGLGVAAFGERGDREDLRRGDDALAATPVNANLEHRRVSSPSYAWTRRRRAAARSASRLE